MIKCLAIILCFGSVFGDSAQFSKPCPKDDKQCFKEEIQKLIPVIVGVGSHPGDGYTLLDPYELKNVKVELAGLNFKTNGTSKGYKDAIVDSAWMNFKEKVFKFDFTLNTILKGNYIAGGKLLMFPITGDGKIKVKTTDVKVFLQMPFEIISGKDSEEHIHLKSFNLRFDIVGGVTYHLTNLFNGNEQLSQGILNFLNTNWKLISNEFAEPVIKPGIEALYKNMNVLFKTMPVKKMFQE